MMTHLKRIEYLQLRSTVAIFLIVDRMNLMIKKNKELYVINRLRWINKPIPNNK